MAASPVPGGSAMPGVSPFRVTARAGRARTGVLETAHGPIEKIGRAHV